MKLNRLYKILAAGVLTTFLTASLTACTNEDITATALIVNSDDTSNKSGQTVSAPQEKEEDIVALEKQYNSSLVKERSVRALALENQIKTYLGNNIDNVGLSYYDINSGEGIVVNGDKTFLAASTVKVQMNMVLGDLIQNGNISENESLSFTQDCYEGGTGILQGQDLSNPLSLSQLSDDSIIYSDNIATNMIIKRIDYYNMRNLIDNKLGHATDHSDNYINAEDETSLLKLLYSNSANNPFYAKLIEDMKNTEFHDRLDLYLPHNIVAHKVGNYDSYVNDVGVIYTENPYILSIYTNGLNNPNEVIAHISKMIYDYQNSQEE